VIETIHYPIPVEQRTQIRFIAGGVPWIICEMGFCGVVLVLRSVDVFPENLLCYES
jgi:hypothetical protein